jgi:hypothetical protein
MGGENDSSTKQKNEKTKTFPTHVTQSSPSTLGVYFIGYGSRPSFFFPSLLPLFLLVSG